MHRLFLATLILLFATDTAAFLDPNTGAKNIVLLPGEFCNAEREGDHKSLLQHYPKDTGIINIYALYLGLCKLVSIGTISEEKASELWEEERDQLVEKRR